MTDRHLEWDGACNARDLGGLRAADGGVTRWGAVVRSEAPAHLSAAGWAALLAHGVRTVVDLTGFDEREPDAAPRPPELTTVRIPLDDHADVEFWTRWDRSLSCTPLYWDAFLDRFPLKVAEVVTAVARARDGGVLVHCGGGRDRTGLVVAVLLGLLGVFPDDIADDHALSHERLRPLYARHGLPDDFPRIEGLLAERGTTAHDVIRAVLARDWDAYLSAAGVTAEDLNRLRERLLLPTG